MPWIRAFIRNVLRRRHVEQDLDEEVGCHLELLAERHRADGTDETEARRAARLEMGGVDQVKDAVRDVRPGIWLEQLWRDLRFGWRTLRRSPGFTTVAVLSLALGIGATTTLFSVTYGVLLKPLRWPDSDRLVRVTETRKGHEPRVRGTMSNGPYHTWAAEHSTIEAIGAGSVSRRPCWRSQAAILHQSRPRR